jgi:hypothetical protein
MFTVLPTPHLPPAVKEVMRLIYTEWWSVMSGALSIPFLILGVYNAWSQKDLFYILAILHDILSSMAQSTK